jgi:hypothetical protein
VAVIIGGSSSSEEGGLAVGNDKVRRWGRCLDRGWAVSEEEVEPWPEVTTDCSRTHGDSVTGHVLARADD